MKSMKSEKASMGKKWFSHVLKTAKKSYKKHKGGEDEKKETPVVPDVPDMPATTDGAGRRRRGGKTQRRRK
jgi:hypothetical protein